MHCSGESVFFSLRPPLSVLIYQFNFCLELVLYPFCLFCLSFCMVGCSTDGCQLSRNLPHAKSLCDGFIFWSIVLKKNVWRICICILPLVDHNLMCNSMVYCLFTKMDRPIMPCNVLQQVHSYRIDLLLYLYVLV